MKIKRGSIVESVTEIVEYGNKVITVGTLGTVYRVKRNATRPYLVIFKGFYQQHWLDFFNVKLVDTAKSMPVVGDLFYSSWGYEQVNIDFYQVVNVSKSSVTVARIKDKRQYEPGGMSGHTVPQPGQFCGEPQTHRLQFDMEGRPRFKLTSYSSAWPCDESPKFFSEWH